MCSDHQPLTWDLLADLHTEASRSVLRARFPQRGLLKQADFSRLCKSASIGGDVGVGNLTDTALEDLHRFRLVVPLVVSERGSETKSPHAHDRHEEWKESAKRSPEGRTELYFHHFQVLAVAWASDHFAPTRLMPGWYESLAEKGHAPDWMIDRAKQVVDRIQQASSFPRLANFYRASPYLALADQLIGTRIRGVINFRGSGTARGKDALEQQSRQWHRWRRWVQPRHVAERIGSNRAMLEEFTRDVWRYQRAVDPLTAWSDLMPFVAWKEREGLKGAALAAHWFREIALLIAHLVGYGFEQDPWAIVDPGEVTWMTKRLGGPLDPWSEEQRKFVATRFGLNPVPAVLWFVEGESEETCLRVLSESEERILDRAGVRVQPINGSLKGVVHGIRSAKMLGVWPCLTVDWGDQGTPRMVDRLIRSGAIAEDQVLYSDPDFEQHNFSEGEIAEAEAALLGARDAPHSISKPKRAEWLARNILVPEVATGSTERPITQFLQTVLDQAQRVRYFRPKYHPNLWGEDKGFPSVRPRPD